MVTFEELPSTNAGPVQRKTAPKPSSSATTLESRNSTNVGSSPMLSTTATQLESERGGSIQFLMKALLLSYLYVLAICFEKIVVSTMMTHLVPSSWLQNAEAEAKLRFRFSAFYVSMVTLMCASAPANMTFFNPMVALSTYFADALSFFGLLIILVLQFVGTFASIFTFGYLVSKETFFGTVDELISGPYVKEEEVLVVAIIAGFVTLCVCVTTFLSSSAFFSKRTGSMILSSVVAVTTIASGSLVSSNALLPAAYRILESGRVVPALTLSTMMSSSGYWMLFWVAPLMGGIIGSILYPSVGLAIIAIFFGDAGNRRRRQRQRRPVVSETVAAPTTTTTTTTTDEGTPIEETKLDSKKNN